MAARRPPFASRPTPLAAAGSRRADLGIVVLPLPGLTPPPPDEPICSARGCREPGSWALLWNNPKLHTPDRRKTWLACDDHRDSLGEFLSLRGFLRETEPASALG